MSSNEALLERLSEAFSGNQWPRFLHASNTASECRIQSQVDRKIQWFDGHFESEPVLPGIAQIHWAGEIGKFVYSLRGEASSGMSNVKFHNPVLPGSSVLLVLSYSKEKGVLTFKYVSNEQPCSEGKILFSNVETLT